MMKMFYEGTDKMFHVTNEIVHWIKKLTTNSNIWNENLIHGSFRNIKLYDNGGSENILNDMNG